ncbi:ETS homologous factor-like isoform X2 [Panulirus ornatus]|uniref:ETS homologous factor-like isoform X2 n=1 Tax=Panulirus ornatus TaxID=150431 RepID=UPI003A8513AD
MDACGYEDLRASFTLDEPLFEGEAGIDSLCQTYLGSMDAYTSDYDTHNTGLLEEMEAFSKMNISDWRGEDCLDWAGSICRRRGLDQTTIDLWAFRNTCGSHLLQFSCQDFCYLIGNIYGPIFYEEFQEMKQEHNAGRKLQQGGASPYSDYASQDVAYDTTDSWDLTTEDIKDLDRYIRDSPWEPLVGGLQDMDLLEQSIPIPYESMESRTPEPVAQVSAEMDTLAVPATDPLHKIRPDAKKRERGPKNWEFVIRLLADPRTNPSLIRWEEQSQGSFRLVQPTAIAKMWGQRANKPNLSYDNFARGLRYHYTTGALLPVSEKQLVYRCGPKALKYLIELKKKSSA